ncbi:HDOD domain-containing protein [Vibrio neptunius]|uniref:HDOD domain-containing protein n=1 Tax=Vibrio neptunius TaxID=170651 RepID=UPI0019D05011|nr:HDOD domain-containing protein [Vibrio neptunius]MBN3571904.1 HDOD domain-containing protein [Vibrio neptunius]QXX05663.1 HDOD domain-containing protein [Vibrio neptunius]
MLLTNKKYNQEANQLASDIAVSTRERYAKWLVSLKYVLDQSDVDSVLSRQSEFCDTVIFNEKERVMKNQRLLLKCEKLKVKERRQAAEKRQKVHESVIEDISRLAMKSMIERLSELEVLKLFGRFPDFSYFLSTAYSPSVSYSKLDVLAVNDHQLKNNLFELCKNPKFCARLGKTIRSFTDTKMAIGLLGIDNSRILFPILMVKPLLRWDEPSTKLIAPKLWQHMILTANVTRLRLEAAEVKSPEQGVAIGILRTISQFAIVNNFPMMFEDALIERMQFYRDKNRREEYYACTEIKPTMSILPEVIISLEKSLTRKVVEFIDWSPTNVHLKNALLEDLEETPMLDRSPYGVALAQAQAYSIYDALERSHVFVDKHKPFWFANVQMPPDALKAIRNSHPGRIELSS